MAGLSSLHRQLTIHTIDYNRMSKAEWCQPSVVVPLWRANFAASATVAPDNLTSTILTVPPNGPGELRPVD